MREGCDFRWLGGLVGDATRLARRPTLHVRGRFPAHSVTIRFHRIWRAGLLAGRAEITEGLLEIRNTVGQEANPPCSLRCYYYDNP